PRPAIRAGWKGPVVRIRSGSGRSNRRRRYEPQPREAATAGATRAAGGFRPGQGGHRGCEQPCPGAGDGRRRRSTPHPRPGKAAHMSGTVRTPRASGAPALAGLAVFAAAVVAAALIGTLSSTATAQDYMRLEQPAWAPPSWVFGPVWTVLYAMIAVAGWNVWRLRGWRGARLALSLYAAQLVLNAAWTPLFFAAGLRGAALADIVLL